VRETTAKIARYRPFPRIIWGGVIGGISLSLRRAGFGFCCRMNPISVEGKFPGLLEKIRNVELMLLNFLHLLTQSCAG